MSSRHIKEANESKFGDAPMKTHGTGRNDDSFQVSASGAGIDCDTTDKIRSTGKGRHLAGCGSRNR